MANSFRLDNFNIHYDRRYRNENERQFEQGLLLDLIINNLRICPSTDLESILDFKEDEESKVQLGAFRAQLARLVQDFPQELPLEGILEEVNNIYSEAINATFPKTKNQLCIVHQIRNSTKFVPYKDRKTVCADLKKIYGAVNLDDAEYALEEFRENWGKKYPSILKSWDANWAELTTFFEYPPEIRHLIYTTNAVEAYHRQLRKFTKTKSILPTDDSIRKVIYFSVREITKKWTMPVRDWGMAYSQIMIFFDDRFVA